jgi:hypothetical protein
MGNTWHTEIERPLYIPCIQFWVLHNLRLVGACTWGGAGASARSCHDANIYAIVGTRHSTPPCGGGLVDGYYLDQGQ